MRRAAWILVGILACSAGYASERLPGKSFGFDLAAGSPQLIGLELRYIGWSNVSVGFGFGSAPVNGVLNKFIALPGVPVALGLSDPYTLQPSATYYLYSSSAFLRYQFQQSGFFLGATIANLTFVGNVLGNLRNDNTGSVVAGAVTGTATVSQFVAGVHGGYQLPLFWGLYGELGLGGAYMFSPSRSVTLGGTALAAVGVSPGGEAAFDSAKNSVTNTFNSFVAQYEAMFKVMPFLFITLGYAF